MVSVKLSMIIIPPALNHELLSLGLPDRVLLIGGRKTQLIGLIFFKANSINIFFLRFYLFIYGWAGSSLLWAGFLQSWRVGAALELWCTGFSSRWLPLLRSTGSQCAGFSS